MDGGNVAEDLPVNWTAAVVVNAQGQVLAEEQTESDVDLVHRRVRVGHHGLVWEFKRGIVVDVTEVLEFNPVQIERRRGHQDAQLVFTGRIEGNRLRGGLPRLPPASGREFSFAHVRIDATVVQQHQLDPACAL